MVERSVGKILKHRKTFRHFTGFHQKLEVCSAKVCGFDSPRFHKEMSIRKSNGAKE
jgi:hypothetical protein